MSHLINLHPMNRTVSYSTDVCALGKSNNLFLHQWDQSERCKKAEDEQCLLPCENPISLNTIQIIVNANGFALFSVDLLNEHLTAAI